MRIALVAAVMLLSAADMAGARAVSPSAARNSMTSWGKPGVSFADYRADAITCGEEASGMDLAGTDPARALAVASRQMENDPQAGPTAVQDPSQAPGVAIDALGMAGAAPSAMQMVGPERQIAKAGDLMKASLEQCLAARGYRRFKLTGQQRHRLAALPVGSEARHAYLHGLASDPRVLDEQAIR